MAAARQAISRGDLNAARGWLEQIHNAYPQDTSDDGSARLLAEVYRKRGDTEAERRVLETLARRDSDALEVFERLAALAVERSDWSEARDYAERVIAVNPMIKAAQERLASAAEQLEDPRALIDAQTALLQQDPADPALAYHRLARAYEQIGDAKSAKRYVLMALEEAPRYREAQQMLLRLVDGSAENLGAANDGPRETLP
jgi:tetratricopeptide (TPR) repeat protein